MNEIKDVYLGRTRDGSKVYVSVRFGLRADRAGLVPTWRECVDHTRTTERLYLAFQGVIVNWNGSIDRDGTWQGCGQTDDVLLDLVELQDGWTVGDVAKLHQIWQEWHLNDMQSRCIHQHGKDPEPCPETGYKYGHRWLFKPLPYHVVSWVLGHFEGLELPEPGSEGDA